MGVWHFAHFASILFSLGVLIIIIIWFLVVLVCGFTRLFLSFFLGLFKDFKKIIYLVFFFCCFVLF